MISIMMILEDQSVCARMVSDHTGRYFQMEVQEGIKGCSTSLRLNDAQMGAVLALAIAGDGFFPDAVTKALYDIAEPVQPAEKSLRLIP